MSLIDAVSDQTFETQVLNAERPVLVDFYADWCAPCRILLPALEDVAAEYAGEVLVRKINIDQNPQTRDRYDIRGIPALCLFDRGQVRERINGVVPRSMIAARIEAVLGDRT